ncbi:uncharacterized protein LOC116344710 [Contarinia nasturtii]|uniref:uncharacterized protein LOC116344710 n=1 Tax=Contarinia nasturtii TaxID=265458 RepID=UPI0012D474BC|nr:uncharacterized protein LOC116344710 [Contarinia nasturtii]XP_031629249.1 uncharacterized protein LOC116344710 [Contarinia nasturtii]XP_031629250.1 uncharacterized protein LOC116344710 [Contarinia nasturtii]
MFYNWYNITQIHSPYRFWVHLKDDVEQIETLMSSMDYYYTSDESMIAKRPIPETQLLVGRVCAALFDSQWHRAEIVEVLDKSLVVFYVDYGTLDEVEKKNVRFLNKRFSKSPIYAHRGCLDRCKPNDGIWTFEAMNVFEQRMNVFKDTVVLVKLTNVNVQEKTLYFDMFDTRGKIDVISVFMIDNNLAYPTNKLLYDFQQRHYNEVYPSFDKLERGKYPSRKRMKQMRDNGFDYLEYEDSILIPEMYGYERIE